MAVNRYYSAVVRVQKDRGQTVVSDGPYRFVRHPSYATGIVSSLMIPILLGSLWALIPCGLVVVGTIIRTALEDRTLQDELDGYKEYAAKVRYRLLPGVW
jgi:protein-S-isoprenylcysteine O-methyltransferase Ste14